MSIVVPIIVIAIILAQIFFFCKNIMRMDEYRKIFANEGSWVISHNENGFVDGIEGNGNVIFQSIKDSINKYLGGNSGSVIDFQLLKDAVDRHCDSIENDVNTLTPIPLYCGLAGTMAGVIIGLTSLLYNGSISDLLTAGGDFQNAAHGVNDLLSGVAWAMLASICGIIFTTWGSLLFKSRKIQGEAGKNTFLAWLQAKLLPELPSDTSEALNNLVKNLNKFNDTFADNTEDLSDALQKVNQSYSIQAEIIKAVHDMDVMKMAKANVQVLKELECCTDKLEQFNAYLDDIHGYTDAIHTFTTKFERESNRLHVLEEIQQFFMRHKSEIAKDTANTDYVLRDSLKTLKEAAGNNISELNKTLTEQAEEFKRIIKDEKETFEAFNNDLKSKFSAEINQFPQLAKQLAEISAIPSKLDRLIERMEKSNANLASNVTQTMDQTTKAIFAMNNRNGGGSAPVSGGGSGSGFPNWMKWTIVASAIIVAATCLTNTAFDVWGKMNGNDDQLVEIDTTVVDSLGNDTVTTEMVDTTVTPAVPEEEEVTPKTLSDTEE